MLSAYTLFGLVLIHALLYLSWVSLFNGLTRQAKMAIPVLNPTYLYHETWPGNTTSLGVWKASLIFTGLFATIIMLIISVTTLPQVRRKHFNLFYFTHLFSILMVVVICLHASTMFYCTAPGLAMWCLDWSMRLQELKVLLPGQISTFGNATIDATTAPESKEIVIQFLFRRVGAAAVSLQPPRQRPRLLGLFTVKDKKPVKSGEWTGKLASSLDQKILEQSNAPLNHRAPERQISLDLSLRLEGPYFSPADPSRYHTVVCLVAGTGISGAMAIAGAFRAVHFERLAADKKSPDPTNSRPVWQRCIISWSVREEDYVDLPDLGQSSGVELQVNLTGPGKPRPDIRKIMAELRQAIPVSAAIWAYISGPKGFIENAKTICKEIPNVNIHAASWEI
ncbi:MAG: hypothetical protein Q9184_002022 [Pyrenodesmia sp. 2 TL-2023]